MFGDRNKSHLHVKSPSGEVLRHAEDGTHWISLISLVALHEDSAFR